MKKLMLFLTMLFLNVLTVFAQDTIIFKDQNKPVLCKIRNITPAIIFYIENNEYKSDYMTNVKYHSKFVQQAEPVSQGAKSTPNQSTIDISTLGDSIKYCELMGMQSGLFTLKIVIHIDYGQKLSVWHTSPSFIRGKDGKNHIFNSMVDALNFMYANGWDFISCYTVTEGNNGNIYHYLLKRRN